MNMFQKISDLVYQGNSTETGSFIQEMIVKGEVSAQGILSKGLMRGMEAGGRDFKANKIYVPEVLVAARTMNNGLDVIKPYLTGTGNNSLGKIVLGTVKGGLHDVGKNLVSIM